MLAYYEYLFNQPQGAMSLENMRNTLRGLYEADFAALRPSIIYELDQLEYPTDAILTASWTGTGVTLTTTTTKMEGSFAMEADVDVTGDRSISVTGSWDFLDMGNIELWQRCDQASSDITFSVEDSSGNISYWDITTDGTPDTWVLSQLDSQTPDGFITALAELDDIVSIGFTGLDASSIYIFDDIKVRAGMRINVESSKPGGYYIHVHYNNTLLETLAQLSPLITVPAGNPRIDVLVYNPDTEILEWEIGAEASSPARPTWDSTVYPICSVYNKVGEVQIVEFSEKDNYPAEGYLYEDLRSLFGKNIMTAGTGLEVADFVIGIAALGVGTAQLAALSVTDAKLAVNAVTATKILNGAITSDKINNGAVVGSKLGSKAVTSSKIDDGAVDTLQIADDSITEPKIAFNTDDIPLGTESFFLPSSGFGVSMSADQTGIFSDVFAHIEFDTEGFDLGTEYNEGTYEFTSNAHEGMYSIGAVISFLETSGSGSIVNLELIIDRGSGPVTIDTYNESIGAGASGIIYLEGNVYVRSGDKLYARARNLGFAGRQFEIKSDISKFIVQKITLG